MKFTNQTRKNLAGKVEKLTASAATSTARLSEIFGVAGASALLFSPLMFGVSSSNSGFNTLKFSGKCLLRSYLLYKEAMLTLDAGSKLSKIISP